MKFSWHPRSNPDETKWRIIFCWRPRIFREDGPWGYGNWTFAWLTNIDRRWISYDFDSLRHRACLPLGRWQYRQIPLLGEG